MTNRLRLMGPTLGDDFPDLRGETQDTNNFSLHEYFGRDWGIVFMHPADFTPVCTTEIGACQSLIDEFEVRNIKICGFSCDDPSSHKGWISDIEAATGERVTFPLFCDPTRMHAIELGVFDPALKDEEGLPLTVRSVFIIDPRKKVALTMTYPSSVGRNFDEILRACDALQRADNFGVVTPANWQPGDKAIVSIDLSDKEANERFGKNGYTTVDLPSEHGMPLSKHYLRYTDDPVLGVKGKKSIKLAIRITKPKLSWRPPKSFALTLILPSRKRGQASDLDLDVETQEAVLSIVTNENNRISRNLEPATQPRLRRASVDYSNHTPWKRLLANFKRETCDKEEVGISDNGRKVSNDDNHRVCHEKKNDKTYGRSDSNGPIVW
ncbi:hypothetical protein ACHAXR_007567 [Thalassiosira sp. AJA248-18]